jgi:hypothetical protein
MKYENENKWKYIFINIYIEIFLRI